MITFKPVVYAHHRRKDGSYNVKIRVTFKCVHRHLPTSLYCYKDDLTRDARKIKNAGIIDKANAEIRRMREACADLSYYDIEMRDVDFVVAHIKAALTRRSFALDFFEWADTFCASRPVSTGKPYRVAVNALERYLGRRQLDINDISRQMMQNFAEHLDGESRMFRGKDGWRPMKGRTVKGGKAQAYIGRIGAIFRAAREKYNDEDAGTIFIPRNPFASLRLSPVAHEGQRNLGADVIQRMIRWQGEGRMRAALDLFLLSFCLMGANLADMWEAPAVDDVWVYRRKKTRDRRADKAEMRVEVAREARPYLERLQGHGRMLGAWPYGRSMEHVGTLTGRMLRRWAQEEGIAPFTFYAARHSWASLARAAGVEKATVDECLAHVGDYALADIYAERDWARINAANRTVLDLFEWQIA